MYQEKTLKLVIGIVLLVVALPGFGMMGFGGYGLMGMMQGYGFGMFSIFSFLISVGLIVLGVYLILESLKDDKRK